MITILLATTLVVFVGISGVVSVPAPFITDVRFDKKQVQVLPSYKRLYVYQSGRVSSQATNPANTIEVYGSQGASLAATQVAADTVMKMTRHMEPETFRRAAEKGVALGIYNHEAGETIRVWSSFQGPEFANEYSLGIATNLFATMTEDNVMCSPTERFGGKANMALHEFAHLIEHEMPDTRQMDLLYCWIDSKYVTWQSDSYAMSSVHEYWAVASQAFFGVIRSDDQTTGGLNNCGGRKGGRRCEDFQENRRMLQRKDKCLYDILVKTWTNNAPNAANLDPEISICPNGGTNLKEGTISVGGGGGYDPYGNSNGGYDPYNNNGGYDPYYNNNGGLKTATIEVNAHVHRK